MAAALPAAHLPVELLLCNIGFRRSWMVLVQNGGEKILARLLPEAIYPLGSPCSGNGIGTSAADSSGSSGAQPARHRFRAAETAGYDLQKYTKHAPGQISVPGRSGPSPSCFR